MFSGSLCPETEELQETLAPADEIQSPGAAAPGERVLLVP